MSIFIIISGSPGSSPGVVSVSRSLLTSVKFKAYLELSAGGVGVPESISVDMQRKK